MNTLKQNHPLTFVRLALAVGTVYDRAGKVLGCRDTYVDATHSNANQTSMFHPEFYGRDFGGVRKILYR